MNNKTATLLPLLSHDKKTVERDLLAHAKVLGGDELRKWAVVVSSVRDEMLLLDPETLKTQETPVPKKYELPRMAPSVPTVKWDERLWLVPYEPEPPGEGVKRVYLRRKPAASFSPGPAGP
jgi:NMD protein affecting ribosome stability and mRNA decay